MMTRAGAPAARPRTPAPRVHVPLRRLALCLDCEECFEIGSETCPACGSTTWSTLPGFLEADTSPRRGRLFDVGHIRPRPKPDEPESARQLVIVAENRASLYDYLRRAFAGNDTVSVILNRRVMQRRQLYGPYERDRRRRDRRSPVRLEGLLGTIGWAVVRLDGGG